jgi:hypothetical protein
VSDENDFQHRLQALVQATYVAPHLSGCTTPEEIVKAAVAFYGFLCPPIRGLGMSALAAEQAAGLRGGTGRAA